MCDHEDCGCKYVGQIWRLEGSYHVLGSLNTTDIIFTSLIDLRNECEIEIFAHLVDTPLAFLFKLSQ
jgi:hypothetical protein